MLEPEGELRAGNAIFNFALTGGAAVGPAVAGGVVAAFGVQTALLLDAVSFYVIACILLAGGKKLPHAEPEPGQVRGQVRAGLGYIRHHVTLRRLLVAQGAVFIFFSAVIPVEVIYAKQTLGAGDTGYGFLLGSWGIGMIIGGFLFGAKRSASLPPLLFFSTLAVGGGYLGMAAAQTLPVACAAAAVGGAGNGVQWVAVMSAVQELTAQRMQARVIGTLESVSSAVPGIGYVAGGLIASGYSPRATFLVAGAGVIAIVAIAAPLVGTKWSDGSVRRLDAIDDGDEIVVELYPAFAPTKEGTGLPARK
jgi:MFS family permease